MTISKLVEIVSNIESCMRLSNEFYEMAIENDYGRKREADIKISREFLGKYKGMVEMLEILGYEVYYDTISCKCEVKI